MKSLRKLWHTSIPHIPSLRILCTPLYLISIAWEYFAHLYTSYPKPEKTLHTCRPHIPSMRILWHTSIPHIPSPRKLCTPQYLKKYPIDLSSNTSSWASENFGTPQDLYNVVRRHVIIPGFQHGQNYDYIYLYPDRKLKYILSTT
jgi:hypothetical protein